MCCATYKIEAVPLFDFKASTTHSRKSLLDINFPSNISHAYQNASAGIAIIVSAPASIRVRRSAVSGRMRSI